MRAPPNTHWTEALRQLEAVVSHAKTSSLDDFIGQWKPMFDIKNIPIVLQSVAAILYEQENESEHIRATMSTQYSGMVPFVNPALLAEVVSPLFEQMLLVDYGFGVHPISGPRTLPHWVPMRYLFPRVIDFSRQLVDFACHCKRGQLPKRKDWDYLKWRLLPFRRYDMADFSIMLYYFHTHHQALDSTEYDRGMTGYTGVLQEIMDEVPTKGADRLVRKLSTDVNEMIPNCVRDPEKRRILTAAAEDIAAKYGLTIYNTDEGYDHQASSEVTEQLGGVQEKTQGWRSFISFLSAANLPDSGFVISKEKKDV